MDTECTEDDAKTESDPTAFAHRASNARRDTTAEWHPCGARRPGGVLGRHEHGGHGSEAAAEAEAVEDAAAAAAPISLAPLGGDGNATVTS